MPTLERLTVRGFKSIRSLEEFELRRLNVLIGANGSGKSNFLGVFQMLSRLAHGQLQRFVNEQGGADALLFGGARRTSSLDVELIFGRGSYRYRFSLEPVGGAVAFVGEAVLPGVATFIDDVAPGTSPSIKRGTSFRGGRHEARVADLGRGEFVSNVLPAIKGWRVYHVPDTSRDAHVRLPQPVRDNLSLKPNAANLAPYLRRLRERHPHHYRQIIDATRLAAPFLGDLIYRREVGERMDLEWSHVDDPDTPLGPLQFSDGTLRFLCLATLLLQPTELQPQVILVDEPELGLHPLALASLAEMLRAASEARQVIVSTQSADLVSEFEPEDVVVVNRRDGESFFKRLEPDVLQDWLEEYSLGQLWKAEVIGGGPAP